MYDDMFFLPRCIIAGGTLLLGGRGRGGVGRGLGRHFPFGAALAEMAMAQVLPSGGTDALIDDYMFNEIDNGSSPKNAKRVSADVTARFPVTNVAEQPERMVVIGDVHGDIGKNGGSAPERLRVQIQERCRLAAVFDC